MSILVIVTNLSTFVIKLSNIYIMFFSYTVILKIQLIKILLINFTIDYLFNTVYGDYKKNYNNTKLARTSFHINFRSGRVGETMRVETERIKKRNKH